MTLVQRTVDQAWGGCQIIQSEPCLEEHNELYGLPYVEDGRWGLFDSDDQVVEIAVDRAWPDARGNRCIPKTNTRYSSITDQLSDDVEYIYGGAYNPHFGHYILETLSRLWPLVDGLKPHQRLLMHGPADPHNWWATNYVRGTFGALGVSIEDITHISAPVRIPRILIPAQSFRLNAFAYPAYSRLCHRIGDILIGSKSSLKNVRPAFLSKARLVSGVTGIVNELEMTSELERHGVEIIYPEELNLMSKISLFRSRRKISSWATSAQHVSLFTPTEASMEFLVGGLAVNSNCMIIDQLNGNNSRYWDANLKQVDPGDKFINRWELQDPIQSAKYLLDLL